MRSLSARLRAFDSDIEIQEVHLSEKSFDALETDLREAQAFFILTGTYWDSWGSPLQKFLEDATPTEGTATWLSKPAAVFVTAHAVGAKGVLSRLQGVLNTLGCVLPPMSGWVYTLAQQEALKQKAQSPYSESLSDLWSFQDWDIIIENILVTAKSASRYRSWPVDRSHFRDRWLEPERA
jgi:chromate reductase